MARKNVEEKQLTLEELIPIYGVQNTEFNTLKKTVDDLKLKIKTAIHAAHLLDKDITIEGWKCKLSVTDTSTMNEDRLLEFAKAHNIDIIRTKEYVDFDALEKLLYAGKIPQDVVAEMESCKESSTKEVLRCTKVKEAKDE